MFWSLIVTLLIIAVQNGQSTEAKVPPPKTRFSEPKEEQTQCLTDHLTALKGWIDKNGYLTSVVDPQTTIDLSAVQNIRSSLSSQMKWFKTTVKFLSLARCKLNRVPSLFLVKDASNQSLSETLEFVTLYGNSFVDISSPGVHYDMTLNATDAFDIKKKYEQPVPTSWSAGFYKIKFTRLIELDLRMCSIETLSPNIFHEMPNLQALYLSENKITTISPDGFNGLRNLIHLDLSRNYFENNQAMIFKSENIFGPLEKLRSLDMSYTKLDDSIVTVFTKLNKNFESISLCQSMIPKLKDYTFKNTSLKYIDVSGNKGILKNPKVLEGIEKTLRIVYAENVGLDSFESFANLNKLEVLKLNNNEIPFLNPKFLDTLNNLKILDLTGNRLTNWFNPIKSQLNKNSSLIYLSIKDNYINLITNEMMEYLAKIKYLALSGNFFVCNCNAKELYELALRNEKNYTNELLMPDTSEYVNKYTDSIYNTAFDYFNIKIRNRKKVSKECDYYKFPCGELKENLSHDGDYVLLDYDQFTYSCMSPPGQAIPFYNVDPCRETMRWAGDEVELLNQGRNELLSLIIIPALTLPVLIFTYIFRKNFKYCFVTVRNSALLSLMNRDDIIDEGTIFNYDVFVSYCNDDRNWVLDELLPHVEKDCNVSVCLHERDFQVGLSILENIVSCMDRSRSIMLIISKQFLLSQWCQFEMHLAQHRLLETRREDLILVLLEEIPRRARPTTLHYLMLTKTYIVWPKKQEEEEVFWRRLKKSLVTYRLIQQGNESLA